MNFSCRRGHTALLRFNRPGETTLWFHCRNMEKSLIGKLITLFTLSSINYMWLSFRISISLYSVDPYNLLFLFYCKYKLKKISKFDQTSCFQWVLQSWPNDSALSPQFPGLIYSTSNLFPTGPRHRDAGLRRTPYPSHLHEVISPEKSLKILRDHWVKKLLATSCLHTQ